MAKKVKNDTEEKSSGKGKKIILVVLVLLAIGAATFGGVYFYLQSKTTTEKVIVQTTYVVTQETSINLSKKGSIFKGGVSVSYDVSNKKLTTEIEEKKIQLQDKLIWFLKTKDVSDFDASKELELKNGIVEALNMELEQGKIINAYISTGAKSANFLVQ